MRLGFGLGATSTRGRATVALLLAGVALAAIAVRWADAGVWDDNSVWRDTQ